MAARGDYLLVAAIDFGTTYSGYAFSMRDTPENIITNKNWGASLGFKSHKTPTSILTDDSGNFLDMGFEAEQRYADSIVDKSETLHLYRQFKMILHKSKEVKINTTVSSMDGTILPAVNVFGYAIKYLREHLVAMIAKSTGRAPEPSEIFWVLTVPAIWSEPSKKFMREAAKLGGCISDVKGKNLLLALEPEAASLCCRRLNIANYDENIDFQFPEGTKYIILDCGGGTVDVTAHEVIENEKIKEILPASGGAWGGNQIDKKFENLLVEIFGAEFINNCKKSCPDAWLKLMSTFETVKKAFNDDKSSKLRVELPYDLLEGNVPFLREKVQDFNNTHVLLHRGVLVLEHPVARELFSEVTSEIIQHVKSLLLNQKLDGANLIFMVGGFSECSLLQEKIKKTFELNNIGVLTPHDCQLSVIKGAVLFGHYPLEITSRISRITLGVSRSEIFDPRIHNYVNMFKDKAGIVRCQHIFQPIVSMGESVKVGSEIKFDAFPLTRDQTRSTKMFYSLPCFPKEPVQYTNDSAAESMGVLTIHYPASKDKCENKTQEIYTFGGTEIHVRVVHVATGKECTTSLDFLSHAK